MASQIRFPPRRRPAGRWDVKQLGAWRDAALVAAAVFYVVGYVFWSWNALRNNLGRLPALETQYFVAGILPTLFLVLLAFALVWAFRLRNELARWVAARPGRGGWLEGAFAICVLLAFGLGFLASRASVRPFFFAVIGLTVILFTLQPAPAQPLTDILRDFRAVLAQKGLREVLRAWLRAYHALVEFIIGVYRHVVTGLVVLALGAIAVIWYALHFYPGLPQAFGGVAPRCAELDVDGSGLAEETWSALAGGNVTAPDGRTRPLLVYFDTGHSLLVKPRGLEGSGQTPTYEISRSSVQAIRWCG